MIAAHQHQIGRLDGLEIRAVGNLQIRVILTNSLLRPARLDRVGAAGLPVPQPAAILVKERLKSPLRLKLTNAIEHVIEIGAHASKNSVFKFAHRFVSVSVPASESTRRCS